MASIGYDDNCMLVEGPNSNDICFIADWLSSFDDLERLYEELCHAADSEVIAAHNELLCNDGTYFSCLAKQIVPDLFSSAAVVVQLNERNRQAVTVFITLGFLTLTGERYQMTLPDKLDQKRVKTAVLQVCAGEKSINPVVTMAREKAFRWRKTLDEMFVPQRLSDRDLLLSHGVDEQHQRALAVLSSA
jgi:hypothetical protein